MEKNDLNQQDRRRLMMLNAPISAVVCKMAIPTIVAFLINSIYSLADTYFVSSLGTNATAAVSVNASLDQMIMMCGSMLAVGSNSYIARLLGQGNEKKSKSGALHRIFYCNRHRRNTDDLRQYLHGSHGSYAGRYPHL